MVYNNDMFSIFLGLYSLYSQSSHVGSHPADPGSELCSSHSPGLTLTFIHSVSL